MGSERVESIYQAVPEICSAKTKNSFREHETMSSNNIDKCIRSENNLQYRWAYRVQKSKTMKSKNQTHAMHGKVLMAFSCKK